MAEEEHKGGEERESAMSFDIPIYKINEKMWEKPKNRGEKWLRIATNGKFKDITMQNSEPTVMN